MLINPKNDGTRERANQKEDMRAAYARVNRGERAEKQQRGASARRYAQVAV